MTHLYEALEQRLYLSRVVQTGGVLNIYGTTNADQINVDYKTVLMGDATLDGMLTLDDLAQLDAAFLFHTANPTWYNGDFNKDGQVNYLDYQLINANMTLPTFLTGYVVNDGSRIDFFPNVTQVNVITIGGGADRVTGNSQNTNYWIDASDSFNISPAEAARGAMHKVNAFFQPWTSDPAAADYIPLELQGQSLRDPTDTQNARRYATASLWGAGPAPTDAAQGTIGDCYFISGLQALASSNPQVLRDHIVDLGDGTYAVDFLRNNVHYFIRVDGDFSAPNATNFKGNLWPLVAEKAFTFFRNYGNSYASLSNGYLPETFNAFNIPSTYFPTLTTDVATLQSLLNQNRAVLFQTLNTIQADVPLIANHTYTLVNVFLADTVAYITLRNPWGVDGYFAGIPLDSNPSDGLITLPLAKLAVSTNWGDAANNANTQSAVVNMPSSGAALPSTTISLSSTNAKIQLLRLLLLLRSRLLTLLPTSIAPNSSLP